jgi:hypothetical protein
MNHHFLHTKKFKIGVATLAVILLILASFWAGMQFGFHRAIFAMHWNDNYEKNFFGKKSHPHGSVGTVVKIDEVSIVVADRESEEKVVLISNETMIKKATNTITLKEVKVGDKVAVIGAPNTEGNVEAKLIRILP